MGGRECVGDYDHGLCGEVLFRITAWIDDDIQIEEAAIFRQFMLPSYTNHHDSQRGNPLRLGERFDTTRSFETLESILDRHPFFAGLNRSFGRAKCRCSS